MEEALRLGAPIRFYRTGDAYGFLSNFSRSPFRLEGRDWRTVEHYFQAQKFAGSEREEAIRLTTSPMVAARMGRARVGLRADWDQVRDAVMLVALRAKFGQNPELARRLCDTGQVELVEHTSKDSYWADGGDGTGRNRLGVLLMQVRDELRARLPGPSGEVSGSPS